MCLGSRTTKGSRTRVLDEQRVSNTELGLEHARGSRTKRGGSRTKGFKHRAESRTGGLEQTPRVSNTQGSRTNTGGLEQEGVSNRSSNKHRWSRTGGFVEQRVLGRRGGGLEQ